MELRYLLSKANIVYANIESQEDEILYEGGKSKEDDLIKERRNWFDYHWVRMFLRETEKDFVWYGVKYFWQETIGYIEKSHGVTFYWATYKDWTQWNNPI